MAPVHAHQRAIASYSEALALLPVGSQRWRDLVARIGDLLARSGDADRARGAYQQILDQGARLKPEERVRFLDNIQKDTSRLKALVDRLLELAKSDNVVPLFDDTVALLPVLENLAGSYSQVRVEGDEATARISEESLGIIASNLIENALGAGATEVILTIVELSNECEITFKDNGSGISPGNRAKIYDAFFTTKRETGGTGLGLGIVRSLVEAHGGEIGLLETAEGAAFKVRLPRA